MQSVSVEDVRVVWIVWKNTDDIEGRGAQYISSVCATEATALRVAKGKYVMGANCPIEKATSYKIGDLWHQPSPVVPPSDDDVKRQKQIDVERSVAGQAKAAIKKAEELGLSKQHIDALLAAL